MGKEKITDKLAHKYSQVKADKNAILSDVIGRGLNSITLNNKQIVEASDSHYDVVAKHQDEPRNRIMDIIEKSDDEKKVYRAFDYLSELDKSIAVEMDKERIEHEMLIERSNTIIKSFVGLAAMACGVISFGQICKVAGNKLPYFEEHSNLKLCK